MISFNITKCKCMLLIKKRNTSLATIFLNNQPLEYVCHYNEYLGVILASNLSWSNHIQEICKKTARVLGMIYHRISKNIDDPSTILKLYTALVRPHLEYAAQVWNPYQEKDIQCLEKYKNLLYECVQTATVGVFFVYHHSETGGYFAFTYF